MINRSKCLTLVVVLCAFSLAATGQTSLVLSSGSATPGGTASLSLSLANSGGTQPAGLQWTLNYPTSCISGITVTAGPASTTAAKTIYCAGSGGTYSCLAAGINSNIIGDGVVANIQLSENASYGTWTRVQTTSPSLKDRKRSFATARIRLQPIAPSNRGRPSAATALAARGP